jgi:hypothetical protein
MGIKCFDMKESCNFNFKEDLKQSVCQPHDLGHHQEWEGISFRGKIKPSGGFCRPYYLIMQTYIFDSVMLHQKLCILVIFEYIMKDSFFENQV